VITENENANRIIRLLNENTFKIRGFIRAINSSKFFDTFDSCSTSKGIWSVCTDFAAIFWSFCCVVVVVVVCELFMHICFVLSLFN